MSESSWATSDGEGKYSQTYVQKADVPTARRKIQQFEMHRATYIGRG
jgi:hypothetical protein